VNKVEALSFKLFPITVYLRFRENAPATMFDLKPPRRTLSLQKAIDQAKNPDGMREREELAEKNAKTRAHNTSLWYSKGGVVVLDWVKENYRTWTGEPLDWEEVFLEEFFLLFGNPWLERIIIEKAAQMGYTEAAIALSAFCTAFCRIPVGFGFEAAGKMSSIVGPRLQPAFDNITLIQELRRERKFVTKREDIDSKDRKITIGSVELTFFYTSTTKTKRASPTQRQATSSLSSFSAWVIIGDEIELWPDGALDIATQRQGACKLPTKVFRGGSTPGNEGGIVNTEIKNSGYLFQWQIKCPHCQKVQFLDAFGNLLLPAEVIDDSGRKRLDYVDFSGKPQDWHCGDRTNIESRIATAYIGCTECQQDLGDTVFQGSFVCVNTGIGLRQLCDRTILEQKPIIKTTGLRLPRLASKLFVPAERIRRLRDTRDPADEIQQGLGKPLSIGGLKIPLILLIESAVEFSSPKAKPDLVILGLDQGPAANYIQIQHWYLGEGKDFEQKWLTAHKQVVWYGEMGGSFEAVDELVHTWGVDWVGMDSDPEIQLATNYARKHLPRDSKKGKVLLFDQVELKGEDFKKSVRNVQGTKVSVYSLHRTFGLDAVRNRIYRGLQHFLPGTNYVAGDDKNLFLHYLTSERNSNGRWVEPPGAADHYLHADNFAEMAALCSHSEGRDGGLQFFSLPRE